MFTWNFQYISRLKLREAVKQLRLDKADKDILVRIHTAVHTESEAVELAKSVKAMIPNANIFGTSTSAVIHKGKLMSDQCVVSITMMDKGSIKSALVPTFYEGTEQPVPVGELCENVRSTVMEKDTKLMLAFLTGRYLDVHKFVTECNECFPGVEMIGGLANTSDINLERFLKSGFVFNEEICTDKGAVFATISGEGVESLTSYATGVEVIGEDVEITDTFGSCILEMDGKDAAQAYRIGVGEKLREDPEITNLFPYVYSDASDIPIFVRYSDDMSIEELFPAGEPYNKANYDAHKQLDIKRKRELITANHNVTAGKKLKRAFIYDKKIIADNRSLFRRIENFKKAETIFGYSCIVRSMIYSNCVKWELTPYESTNMCGCITEGEIANINGKNTFANCSFVVSAIGEGEARQKFNPYAFSHTNTLSADNERLMNYLNDVEKLFNDVSNIEANALQGFVRACELKLLYSNKSKIPNGSAMLMDIELKGIDRICMINIPENRMLKSVFGENVTSLTRRQFENKCINFADSRKYKVYEAEDWTIAIGVPSYTESLTAFEKNMRALRESLLETSEDCIAVIPIMCVLDDCRADNIYAVYNAAQIEMKQKNIQFAVYDNSSDMMNEEALRDKYKMVNVINYAIANDGVVPYYQGIHNNKFDHIKHYESLMRLMGENGTVYYPGQFLDIAREFGTLYDTISSIMIHKVFKRFKDSEDTRVSINLGIRDILNSELLEYIYGFLSTVRHPDNFIFEILENEDIDSWERVTEFVKQIHTLGGKIALDDFGSGFSNLQHIINLDLDYIKIDGSIIRRCTVDDKCESLISVIANWEGVRNGRIAIVAEFVENEEIQNLLMKYGIDYSQGYFFSKPDRQLVFE